jgi:hypothetical protein
MLKKAPTALLLPLLLFFGNSSGNYASQLSEKTSDAPTGTLQKMIVESGTATMELDLNRLDGIGFTTGKFTTLQFAAAANSFFPVLVFNDSLRAARPGSIALALQNTVSAGVNAPGYSVGRGQRPRLQ